MDANNSNLGNDKHVSFLALENLATSAATPQETTSELSGVKPFSNARISFEVNLQPEKIVEDYKYEDGSHSYRVRWKDTWIHEQLIPAYQYLVDDYWADYKPGCSERESNNVQLSEEIATQTLTEEELQQLEFSPPLIDANTLGSNDIDNNTLGNQSSSNSTAPAVSEERHPDTNKQTHNETRVPDIRIDEIINENTDIEKDNNGLSESSSKILNESARLKRKRKSASILKKYAKRGRGRPKKSKCCVESDGKENKTYEKGIDNSIDTSNEGDKFQYSGQKGPCTCNICGKVISNKYGLREHQAVVHFKNGKFQCDICGKRVTNKRALNLHMTSHSNERSFVCDQCGSSHKTKGNLNYHIKTMHEMVKNFRCDICFKTFKVQADLKEHCFSMHSNAGVITCIVCKKKLTTALSIYTHSVMHSGAREYECEVCGYAFKTLTGLKEHKITHLETKPIRNCPYCERKFYSRSQYNAHVMRHTADGSLITFKCPICEVKFQHKSSYNRHVIRHQPGGDLEFPKENPYLLLAESELPDGVCHKCRKYYASKSGFYLHLKKCRDGIVQQYQCPYCERGCSNKSSLKRHVQRRHKEMDFENQAVQPREVIQETAQTLEAPQQPSAVIAPENGIQFQTAYFDHGYGNQIATVNANQLSTVDVQLLIDDPTNSEQNDGQTNTILGNVTQVPQITEAAENTQNLHILTESEAAELAAQLSQHGVIVRSSGDTMSSSHDQEQQIIVSAAHIDSRTGQLFVSHSQAAEILANAQALRASQLSGVNGATIALQDDQNEMLSNDAVLQFENRPAVIQLHSTNTDIPAGAEQVMTAIQNQQLQTDTELQTASMERIESTFTSNAIHAANTVINENHMNVGNTLNSDTVQHDTTVSLTTDMQTPDNNVRSNDNDTQMQENSQNQTLQNEIQEHQIVLNELQEDTDVSNNVIML